jgi:hypothetical protein
MLNFQIKGVTESLVVCAASKPLVPVVFTGISPYMQYPYAILHIPTNYVQKGTSHNELLAIQTFCVPQTRPRKKFVVFPDLSCLPNQVV